jgi:hypothetical protein
MHTKERAEWRRHRHSWGDVLQDAAAAVGETRALQLLLQPLAEISAAVQAGSPFDWRSAELSLHCVR